MAINVSHDTLGQILCVDSVDRRRNAIQAKLDAELTGKHFVRLRGSYLELPVISVEHRNLLYRGENGRILSELRRLTAHSAEFAADLNSRPENPAVQQVLHDLLLKKAQDRSGPIYDEFRRFARQTEPLLITRNGIVINGNRRLASMRQLLADGGERYRGYELVSVAVLPDATTLEDIEFIEAALQMAPELKLPYSWVNRRLKLREHARDLSLEVMIEAYRFDGVEAIEAELRELELGERFLAYVGRPKDYAHIEEMEDLFVAFAEQLALVEQPWNRELWELIGFSMLASVANLEKELSHYFPFAEPAPAEAKNWILRALAETKAIVEAGAASEIEPLSETAAADLQAQLRRRQNPLETSLLIFDLADSFAVQHNKILGPARAISHLRAARDSLVSYAEFRLPSIQIRQLQAEIAAIQYIASGLADAGAAPRDVGEPASLDLMGILYLKPHASRDASGRIHISAEQAGHAVYGPYLTAFSGKHQLDIAISAPPGGLLAGNVVRFVRLEAVLDGDDVLAKRIIHIRGDGRKRAASLSFVVPETVGANRRLEVRVVTLGRFRCVLESCTIARSASGQLHLGRRGAES